MLLKVLIAEDNQYVRLYLKKVIEEVTNVKVVATTGNGRDAIDLVLYHQPQVLFLDIEMPEINGIEVARRIIETQRSIHIIFATAHPNYTLEAFELYSYDYILKPFDEDRIKKTIGRLKESICQVQENKLKQTEGLFIQSKDRKVFIRNDEIIYVENQKRKVLIRTERGDFLINGSIDKFEELLDTHCYYRSHRGFLVNTSKIKEIVPSGRTFEIVLNSGDRVMLSRDREKILREVIKLV